MKTIKITTLLCSILLLTTTVFCQKVGFKVLNEPIIVGRNNIKNSNIKGVEYRFPDRIHQFCIDTVTNYITVQLRGVKKLTDQLKSNGNILQYDLKNNKILWTKPIDDYETQELLKFGNLMIFNDYNDAYGIDENTGEEQENRNIAF